MKAFAEIVNLISESDTEVSIHPEVIARNEQDALLLPYAVDERCGIDWMMVSDVDNRTSVRRMAGEYAAVRAQPIRHDRKCG